MSTGIALRRSAGASGSRAPDEGVPRCTTKQHHAHVTEAREVFYPWHPWFGRVVYIHEVIKRGTIPAFLCSLVANRTRRCLEVPSWMFDRSVCLHLTRVETPQASRVALDNLKVLLSDISDRVSPAHSVIGARHSSHENRGDADAPREPAAPDQTTRPVPSVLPRPRPDQPAERGARDSGTPDGAHAREAEGKQICQRRNGRARR